MLDNIMIYIITKFGTVITNILQITFYASDMNAQTGTDK